MFAHNDGNLIEIRIFMKIGWGVIGHKVYQIDDLMSLISETKQEDCGYCGGDNPDPNHMCDPCWDFMQNPPTCDCDIFNNGCSCLRMLWETLHGSG